MKYVLALDQGTTSSRAILFDKAGSIRSVAQKEFRQFFPKPGWVEHDATEIWSTQAGVALEAITNAGADAADIDSIGITNQRETTVVWDRSTGQPIHHAIVWQDRRTAEHCARLRKEGLEKTIRQKTGLVLDAYFSGTKLAWLLKHVPGAKRKAEQGKLAFGTVDSWLIWNLTGGRKHVTDPSNASRTMLFNIKTGTWDKELLEILEVPESVLPEVVPSSGICGEAVTFKQSVPIAGMAGSTSGIVWAGLP